MTTDLPNPDLVEDPQLQTAAKLDKLAVLLSGVCVLHCLLAPVAFTLLPILTLNTMWEDILFHQMMLWLVLPTSTVALLIGCRKHRGWMIVATGFVGMAMLVTIALLGHDVMSPLQERIATVCAGIVLATSHVLNYRACQRITCKDNSCATKHHH